MKARYLIGKTIASIRQERVFLNGHWESDIQVIRFTDGTKLVLGAFDGVDEQYVGGQFLDRAGKVRE